MFEKLFRNPYVRIATITLTVLLSIGYTTYVYLPGKVDRAYFLTDRMLVVPCPGVGDMYFPQADQCVLIIDHGWCKTKRVVDEKTWYAITETGTWPW